MSAVCNELNLIADGIRFAKEVGDGEWRRLIEGIGDVLGWRVMAALEHGVAYWMEEAEEGAAWFSAVDDVDDDGEVWGDDDVLEGDGWGDEAEKGEGEKVDPVDDAEALRLARKAVHALLSAIEADPAKYWVMGPMTNTYECATEAWARMNGMTVEEANGWRGLSLNGIRSF